MAARLMGEFDVVLLKASGGKLTYKVIAGEHKGQMLKLNLYSQVISKGAAAKAPTAKRTKQ